MDGCASAASGHPNVDTQCHLELRSHIPGRRPLMHEADGMEFKKNLLISLKVEMQERGTDEKRMKNQQSQIKIFFVPVNSGSVLFDDKKDASPLRNLSPSCAASLFTTNW